jgi:DNA-3-methyladenine glycosylase II
MIRFLSRLLSGQGFVQFVRLMLKIIIGNLWTLFRSGSLPSPDQILVTQDAKLRQVGLSGAKVKYVKSLAEHIRDGKLELEKLNKLSNLEISRELTAVKGIGEWTAHMFLIFAMARLDVLAIGDLGIKAGTQKLYSLPSLPSPEEITKLAQVNNWHPYESVACWYVWHAKDNMPTA